MVKKVTRKLITICLFLILNNINAQSNIDELSFVILGHTYSTIKTQETRDYYINSINNENPDYVFILGDSEINNTLIFNDYTSKINTNVYFSPGNHEMINSTIKEYKDIVGYANKLIVDDKCNFILLNSLDEIESINNYLFEAFQKINDNNPIVLLTHHRIWDENLLSENPYEHDKSYLFTEIDSIYRSKIDYIFAGNSSAQYFGKQYCQEHKTNKNVVYWVDNVDDIACYSVGMKYHLNYTNAMLRNNRLAVMPISLPSLNLEANEINVAKDINKEKKAIKPNKKEKENRNKKLSIIEKLKINFKRKSVWISFIIGVFCTILFVKVIKFK